MASDTQPIADTLTNLLGPEYVLRDPEARVYFSRDLSWEPSETADIVIQPGSAEELASAVKEATAASLVIVPRGGGMSYTQGFTPERTNAVLIDTQRLNHIVEINPEDMYVTVECGCTWEQLYLALQEHGLRTPYWGPTSGRFATVGGAISQNSLFYGSARHGCVAESVLGLEVVLADGTLIRTGSGASKVGSPFFRYFGPDLTGLFLSDTGAFGVKTKATLKLVPVPPVMRTASFAFAELSELVGAQCEMARFRLASEMYGFDQHRHQVLAQQGFAFLADVPWSLHVVVEDFDHVSAQSSLDRLRAIAVKTGREIEGTVPQAMRSAPFAGVRSSILGPRGQNWLPVHAFLPLSKAKAGVLATQQFFAQHAEAIEQHGIEISYLTASSGTDFVLEPMLFWHDEPGRFRLERVSAKNAERWKDIPANPTARHVVQALRRELSAVLCEMGGLFIQLGKYYPYQEQMDPHTWQIIESIKHVLDPAKRMNPGALGLG